MLNFRYKQYECIHACYISYNPSNCILAAKKCPLTETFHNYMNIFNVVSMMWLDKGLCKERKIPKIRVYYGSGWVGPCLTLIFFWRIIPKSL